MLAVAIGAARARDRQGPGLGLGPRRDRRVVRRRRRCSSRRSLARSARHPAPVVEPAILRVRSFAVANVGDARCSSPPSGRCCSPASLFLTGVWGYSMLKAGLALAPGTGHGRASSPFRRAALADRFGQRAVGDPGRAALRRRLRLVRSGRWARRRTTPPTSCPAGSSAGAGVGLSISTLSSAAAASLPPERFATGTGVFGMSRQIGTALGHRGHWWRSSPAPASSNPIGRVRRGLDVHAHHHVRRRRHRRSARTGARRCPGRASPGRPRRRAHDSPGARRALTGDGRAVLHPCAVGGRAPAPADRRAAGFPPGGGRARARRCSSCCPASSTTTRSAACTAGWPRRCSTRRWAAPCRRRCPPVPAIRRSSSR